MNIEKNVCVSSFLEILGKTKDDLKTRADLVFMGMHKELELIKEKKRKHTYLPLSCYILSIEGKYVCVNV